MGTLDKRVEYYPTPTGARFHNSAADYKCIMGPVGSGKSVTCVMELLRKAQEQAPQSDNVRRTRWARLSPSTAIRITYPSVTKRSTMPVTLPFETFNAADSWLIFMPFCARDRADNTSKRGSVVAQSSRSFSRKVFSIKFDVFRIFNHALRRTFDRLGVVSGFESVIFLPLTDLWPGR